MPEETKQILKQVIQNEIAPLLIGLRNEIKDIGVAYEKGQSTPVSFSFTPEAIQEMKHHDGKTPERGVDYFNEKDIAAFTKASTPVKGKDYFTKKEITALKSDIKKEIKPVKNKDYFDGLTPVKGKDYFTKAEIKEFLALATPVKGVHYKDGIPGAPGKKGTDGTQISAVDIRNKLESLKGTERLSISAIKGLAERLDGLSIGNGMSATSDAGTGGIDNITGLIQAGTNVTITGSGTTTSPYVISATGGGGGSSTWGSITGTLSAQTDLQTALNDLVPYTGASASVFLGSHELNTTKINASTTVAGGTDNLALEALIGGITADADTIIFRAATSLGLSSNGSTIAYQNFDSLTVDRTITWQDGDGTVAFLSDIPTSFWTQSGGTIYPTTDTDKLLVGTEASTTTYPGAQGIFSNVASADVEDHNIGVVGAGLATLSATPNVTTGWGVGGYFKGWTNGTARSAGVVGEGMVNATGDVGASIGVRGYANQTHAGGDNIGLYGNATGSSTGNYALYMPAGNIYSGSAQTWTLGAGTSALNIDSGTLNIDSTNHRVGVGNATPTAKFDIVATTEQLRLAYNSTNYLSNTISSNGSTTFAITSSSGTPTFNFNKEMIVDLGTIPYAGQYAHRITAVDTIFGGTYDLITNFGYNYTTQYWSAQNRNPGVIEFDGGTQSFSFRSGNGGYTDIFGYNKLDLRTVATGTISLKNGADTYIHIDTAGKVGLGLNNTSPSAVTDIIGTTKQLSVRYDESNRMDVTVGSTGGVTFDAVGSGSAFTFSDDVKLGTVGNGLYIKEGTNATMGTATLSSGTVTVNTTKVTANSRIFLTVNGGTLTNVGSVYVSARTAGTSFTISSTNILDTSDVAWVIVEPA